MKQYCTRYLLSDDIAKHRIWAVCPLWLSSVPFLPPWMMWTFLPVSIFPVSKYNAMIEIEICNCMCVSDRLQFLELGIDKILKLYALYNNLTTLWEGKSMQFCNCMGKKTPSSFVKICLQNNIAHWTAVSHFKDSSKNIW